MHITYKEINFLLSYDSVSIHYIQDTLENLSTWSHLGHLFGANLLDDIMISLLVATVLLVRLRLNYAIFLRLMLT